MAVASFRSDKRFERLIQQDLKDFNFSTKTEYIRQAIRELHERLSTEQAIAGLAKTRGFAKRAGYKDLTPEEYERNRAEAAEEVFSRIKSLQAKKP